MQTVPTPDADFTFAADLASALCKRWPEHPAAIDDPRKTKCGR
jgi:hypothetical protein